MKNPSLESSALGSVTPDWWSLRYACGGSPRPSSLDVDSLLRSGDLVGRELLLDEDSVWLCDGRGRGEESVGVSESGSTRSFEKAFGGIALGGRAGRDFSFTMGECSFSRAFAAAAALDFFLRRAMSVS
jgi:hypothetical protein